MADQELDATKPQAEPLGGDRAGASDAFFDALLEQSANEVAPVPEDVEVPGADPSLSDTGDVGGDGVGRSASGVGDALGDMGLSALSGVAKSFFEAKDAIVGEPNYEDKADFRNTIETSQAQREQRSALNGLARGVAQFTTGFIGVGKLMPFLKGGTAVSGFAKSTIRGSVVGAMAFDPHEERLSNFVEQYPTLSNPITRYLAADLDDSKAEGRFKAAIESIIGDVVVTSTFALGLRAMKLRRAGKHGEAAAAEAEADQAITRARAKGYWYEGEQQNVPANEAGVWDQQSPGGPVPQAGDGTGAGPSNPGAGGQPIPQPGDVSGAPGATPGVAGPSGAPAGGVKVEAVEKVPRGGKKAQEKPEAIPTQEVTPEMMERLRKDNAAIAKNGGLEAAQAAGYRFHGRESLPWQKFTGPEEAEAWFGQALEASNMAAQKARGGRKVKHKSGLEVRVMADTEVDNLVNQWVKAFNEDPAQVRQLLATAPDKSLPAKMETAFLIANRAAADTFELAQKIELGNFAGFGSKAEADAALKHRLGVAVEMANSSRAMLASAGRTLRRARGEFKARADAMANINIEATNPDALRAALLATGGDTAKINKVGQPGFMRRLLDYASGLQAANLLWGWSTHTINFATSMGNTVWRPAEVMVGSTYSTAKGVVMRDADLRAQGANLRRQARREITQIGAALYDSFKAAAWAFVRGDSSLTPHNIEAMVDQTQTQRIGVGDLRQVFRPVKSLEDVAWNAWTATNVLTMMPLRVLGSADEFVRNTRYRAVVLSKAMGDADDLKLKPGSQDYKDYIKGRVEASVDESGLGLDPNAVAEAKQSVFAQDLLQAGTGDTWGNFTSLGAMVQNNAAQHPFLRVIVPFIRTPTNLFRYGVKLTPGLNILQKEYVNAIRGDKGVEAQARAVGQMMLGTLIMSIAANLRMQGTITGGGPQQGGRTAKEWRAEGNRPYAYTWVDSTGKKQFFQFNRFDPIQFPFALASDFVDMKIAGRITEEEENSMAAAMVLAVAHQFRDKTYTQNIANFLDALVNDNKMEPNAKRMAANFIPFSTLFRSLAQQQDPVLREVNTWMDAFKAGLPGFSDQVPPRYDAFGQVVKVPGRFLSEQTIAGPLARALDESMANTGNTILPMSPRDSGANLDLRDLTLEDGRTAYDRLQELSAKPFDGRPSMLEALERVVKTPAYQAAPHGRTDEDSTKEYMLARVVSDYRRAAKEVLKGKSGMYREALGKRAIEIFQATMAGRKNARVEAGRSQIDTTINPLLESYGLGALPKPQSVPE